MQVDLSDPTDAALVAAMARMALEDAAEVDGAGLSEQRGPRAVDARSAGCRKGGKLMATKDKEQPVQEHLRRAMNILGGMIDNAINPDGVKRNGFALLAFPFGQPDDEHWANYISITNANREDMLATMKEFIARAEGRYHD